MACIAVYCSRELFPIPVTYVYIIYDTGNAQRHAIDLFHVTSRALHVPFIRRFGVQLPHTNT